MIVINLIITVDELSKLLFWTGIIVGIFTSTTNAQNKIYSNVNKNQESSEIKKYFSENVTIFYDNTSAENEYINKYNYTINQTSIEDWSISLPDKELSSGNDDLQYLTETWPYINATNETNPDQFMQRDADENKNINYSKNVNNYAIHEDEILYQPTTINKKLDFLLKPTLKSNNVWAGKDILGSIVENVPEIPYPRNFLQEINNLMQNLNSKTKKTLLTDSIPDKTTIKKINQTYNNLTELSLHNKTTKHEKTLISMHFAMSQDHEPTFLNRGRSLTILSNDKYLSDNLRKKHSILKNISSIKQFSVTVKPSKVIKDSKQKTKLESYNQIVITKASTPTPYIDDVNEEFKESEQIVQMKPLNKKPTFILFLTCGIGILMLMGVSISSICLLWKRKQRYLESIPSTMQLA